MEAVASPPEAAWYAVCESRRLGAKPLAVTLFARTAVLFRDSKGAPAGLVDRCPHRNVPLSLGRVRGGELECAYHGWRFAGSGECLHVPGLVDQRPSPARNAPAHAARERDGLVWIWGRPGEAPHGEPFAFPHLGETRYTTLRRSVEVGSALFDVAENAMDVPHTAYLHGGLFRDANRPRNEIEVALRRSRDRVEAEYCGEPRPPGLVARLLAPAGGTVVHFDRFLLPSIVQVEYRLGGATHFIVTAALTPVGPRRTRIFTVVSFRLPFPGWLVSPWLRPLALRVFHQDAGMLERQTENLARFGGEVYRSTELDFFGPQIQRLWRHAADDVGTANDVEVVRNFRMRT
jgi:phenylpropionate dioxygenase-like ring-hydroxylating dioxygenase large terminal subunit